MIEIIGLIVILSVSIIVLSCWVFLKKYCQLATEYLSEHPPIDFIIHMFTGFGSGLLISLWMPILLALILGFILIFITVILYFIKFSSIGMHLGLPISVSIALLSYPWIPRILTLILGAIFMILGESLHYFFPNLVIKEESINEKS